MNESLFQNSRVKNAVLVLIIVASVFLAAKTLAAMNMWDNPSRDTRSELAVSGTGESFVVPDVATFSFSVTEEAKTVKEAQDKASKKNNDIVAYLKAAGIEDRDVKTQGYNIYPKYESNTVVCVRYPCPQPDPKIVGYTVSQTVQVKVRDTAKAGEVLTGIGSRGVQNLSGLELTVDDEDAAREEARKLAIEDAEEKAKVLARDLGVRLVRVVNFSEQGNGGPVYMYEKDMALEARNAVGQSAAVPNIPTGENKITSVVTITYEIR